ncbi:MULTISPECIES: SDR family NAD(P)-dependent oxidoreductase [unclassified Streptomyces]|uniref:SDR family NAD(P)-dependent oxidoreductase n=1 Tax=unclassified Streptomyces TaxID=2593676 RepID=UPI00081E471D|nr:MULTISPECIES: SDR family NAD(P)-dependent oxidoreductase [unclassified Streptomyces]MYR26810.1 SDR family NAD(P)-dependent oxidoreductase [Streptomyces sp. SID4945]SCD78585.1 NAD(P)-dependent dehydrogenase, short-chain alcohol dehydrogenase family [Streptomyces sp. TverLS-915]SCF11673.1 NAD(P)-dependent dehydrogenase, short-chain alcohol dehydrogenase family [Streptomyces sp. LcepLS]
MLTTPFGFSSTTDDVLEDVSLAGRRAVVTGATSGLGTETARALAAAGAEVVLAARRPRAAAEAAAEITRTTGNAAVSAAPLDLADLASVREFTAGFTGPLHILVNNAGIMALPELRRTPEGREAQFGTNFVGHFALTTGLYPALAAAGGARIVSVSSLAHLMSPVVFDDVDFRFRPYDPWAAYAQSKTADILLAVGADRRWAGEGIRANALNPGAIATNLQQHTGGLRTPEPLRKTVAQGAATSVLLAASPLLDGVGGRYFEDCGESPVVEQAGPIGSGGVAPYALDAANADRLWELAGELITA